MMEQIIEIIEQERATYEQRAREAISDHTYQWATGMERGLNRALDLIREEQKRLTGN